MFKRGISCSSCSDPRSVGVVAPERDMEVEVRKSSSSLDSGTSVGSLVWSETLCSC